MSMSPQSPMKTVNGNPFVPRLYRCTIQSTHAYGYYVGEARETALYFSPEQLRQGIEALEKLLAWHEACTRTNT